MALQKTEIIRRRYDRTAKWYDVMDRMLSNETRKQLLSQATGETLEVGVGTGKNLPYYPAGCRVTAIDFSSEMLKRAAKRATEAPVPVKLMQMDAQHMDFPDATFDTVVATCVFCSVPDPVAGLREVRRVCKPDGRIILLEHVRSESKVFGKLMDWLNPVSLYLVGSNINRRTVENVEKAGIKLEQVTEVGMPIVKLIKGKP